MLFLAEGGTNPVFQEKVGKQISRLQHRKKDGGTGRGAVLRSGLLRRSVNFEGQEVKVVTEGKVKAALFPVGRKSGGELEEMCRDGSLLATFTAMLPRTCFFHTCKME